MNCAANHQADGGLVAKACADQRLRWNDDLGNSKCAFEQLAAESGMRSAVAVPVQVRDEVAAVLEFFTVEQRPANAGLSSVLIDVGTLVGRVIERRRAEQEQNVLETQVRASQKLESLGILAGGIAHDFNNILQCIFGHTQLSLMSVPREHEAYEAMLGVEEAAEHARELVTQILAFSRKAPGHREALRIATVLDDTIKLMGSSLCPSVTLVTEYDASSGVVLANPTQIQQVLLNLITNACHAMKDSAGMLRIAASPELIAAGSQSVEYNLPPGTYVCIEVTDTGIGMDEATQSHLFEPLFTTKQPGEGTGLGLATALGIVSGCSGAITVESQLGNGSTFRVFLPACDLPETQPAENNTDVQPGVGRILFVDDAPELTEIGKRSLERMGYVVDAFTNSHQALKAFQQDCQLYDLVITDAMMPRMTGQELAREIHNLNPAVPVILTSGTIGVYESQLRSLGIQSFMAKPMQLRSLGEEVKRLIHRKASGVQV